ncbi:zinc-binding dehydrogenase [Ornithinimicrobium humiphilum]|uniref:NADPH:quinone reductase-like Zn-dependent oxidoreductase n=1 Tax=Ornithinimicrobium humiphilum TaxID=125288 RepID=A0A543KR55_9MICO|nr:zinc-binding dehydrogenase [Ornithinimicrobium humiphilum]TQM97566.1 NADPH:quinone reductase-like Zn-dependent oxidoreductase [Ornithinimicrobium humiphilum]
MLAAYAAAISPEDPLSGLVVDQRPEPEERNGWRVLPVVAAGLNHHDLWSLRGVGLPPERLPMILGCDAVVRHPELGEVVVLPVVAGTPGWADDITLDPRRSLLSELHQGTLAEQLAVPEGHWVVKPEHLSAVEAAALSTAWLTAYRMLFRNAGVRPGDTVLVQGAGGGVATALVQLGAAAGLTVWVTSRSEEKRRRALELGAQQAFETGARLPARVDAVLESVGAATWSHSVNALRPGGTIVICGATSGDAPPRAELTKIFFKQLRVVGSTMGTLAELQQLCRFVETAGLRPVVDSTFPLSATREALQRMESGELVGKIGITVEDDGTT